MRIVNLLLSRSLEGQELLRSTAPDLLACSDRRKCLTNRMMVIKSHIHTMFFKHQQRHEHHTSSSESRSHRTLRPVMSCPSSYIPHQLNPHLVSFPTFLASLTPPSPPPSRPILPPQSTSPHLPGNFSFNLSILLFSASAPMSPSLPTLAVPSAALFSPDSGCLTGLIACSCFLSWASWFGGMAPSEDDVEGFVVPWSLLG